MKGDAEAPRQVFTLRLSPAERALADMAARVNRQTVRQFVRDAIVCAAGDCLELPAAKRSRRGLVVVLQPPGAGQT